MHTNMFILMQQLLSNLLTNLLQVTCSMVKSAESPHQQLLLILVGKCEKHTSIKVTVRLSNQLVTTWQ